jgi:hypothetical protein
MIAAAASVAVVKSPIKANPQPGSKGRALVVVLARGTFLGQAPPPHGEMS